MTGGGFVSAAFVVVCNINVAWSAGMTSHNVAARRASQFEYYGPKTTEFNPDHFYGLAEARSDAIQAGSPFPDFLYACGDEHDAGEEAHWTPFQIESVNYIRETYPNWATDRDSDGAGLVAFTLGVTSHYITDINWHGLEVIPSGEGLIRTMGYADFNCTNGDLCGTAHSAADTGGEFAAAASLDLTWYPQDDWFVPTDDLVNIYANMNALGEGPLVEPQWINECAVIFYAGSFGVSRFGDLIYPLLAPSTGGLLLEGYFDFPVGGVDDDAAWTGFMWNRLADWLVYGPPPPDPAPNKEQLSDSVKRRLTLRETVLVAKKIWVQAVRSKFLRDFLADENGQSAPSSRVGGSLFGAYDFRKSDGKRTRGAYIGIRRRDTVTNEMLTAQEQQLSDELEFLGNSLIDHYLLRMIPDLLTPHSSSSILKVRKALRMRAESIAKEFMKPAAFETEDDNNLAPMLRKEVGSGTAQHEYYGSSLSVSSNGDVLVGAPGAGRTGGPQEGAAHLIIVSQEGDAAAGLPSQDGAAQTSVTLRGGQQGGVTDAFPSYERFGWSSAACDVNGDEVEDWVVCAPSYLGGRDTESARGNYTGRCDIFYGPFNTTDPTPVPDASIYGDKEWGNFGYAIVSGDVDGDGMADIVISAPYAGSYPDVAPNDRDATSSQGAVYVYLAKSFFETFAAKESVRYNLMASSAADFLLQREESFQWFGKSLAITETPSANLLVIGAPTFHSTEIGAENSAVGKVFVYNLATSGSKHVLGISGCGHAGRTGHAVVASPSHLVLSEPSYNVSDAAEGTAERDKSVFLRAGRVLSFDWDTLFSLGRSELRVCELVPVVMSVGEDFEARYGSSLALSTDATQVLIGAPLADDTSGAVYSMDMGTGSVEVLVRGKNLSQSKGRIGQAIAVFKNAIYVGAPYASVSDGEQGGKVYSLKAPY